MDQLTRTRISRLTDLPCSVTDDPLKN